MEQCLLNKVMKQVESGGKNCDFSWLTVKSLADRRLVAVLGVNLMVKIVEGRNAQTKKDFSTWNEEINPTKRCIFVECQW